MNLSLETVYGKRKEGGTAGDMEIRALVEYVAFGWVQRPQIRDFGSVCVSE